MARAEAKSSDSSCIPSTYTGEVSRKKEKKEERKDGRMERRKGGKEGGIIYHLSLKIISHLYLFPQIFRSTYYVPSATRI